MIHVDFRDFNEMVEFARQLLGGQARKVPEVPEAPAVQPVPTAPMVQPAPMPTQPQAAAVPTAAVTAPATAAPAAPTVPAPATPTVPAPATPAAPASQPAAAVPTTQSSYTLDDLARAGMTLMDCGRQGDLLQLLARFGVGALPALPQAQYGAFATALREMGAQI